MTQLGSTRAGAAAEDEDAAAEDEELAAAGRCAERNMAIWKCLNLVGTLGARSVTIERCLMPQITSFHEVGDCVIYGLSLTAS